MRLLGAGASIRRVIVSHRPQLHFSAFGMLQADVRRDYVLTRLQRLAECRCLSWMICTVSLKPKEPPR